MMIETLDRLAYTTNNFLTRTSIIVKILFVAVVIAGISSTYSLTLLLTWYAILLAMMARKDFPLYTLFKISLYPLVFVLVFGISFLWGDWVSIAIIGMKVIIASTTLLTLIASTPYPAIFKTLQPAISPLFASILFLSYRSLFVLSYTFSETMSTLRLRGAFRIHHPIASLRAIGQGVGVTLLKSLHLSETMYDTMRLRGFHNKIYFTRKSPSTVGANLTTVTLALLIITFLIITKWPSPL